MAASRPVGAEGWVQEVGTKERGGDTFVPATAIEYSCLWTVSHVGAGEGELEHPAWW